MKATISGIEVELLEFTIIHKGENAINDFEKVRDVVHNFNGCNFVASSRIMPTETNREPGLKAYYFDPSAF